MPTTARPGVGPARPRGFEAAALVRALAPRSTEIADADVATVVVEAAAEDAGAARARLEADLATARAELARAEDMLRNEGFVARAPADRVQAERDKAERRAAE